MESKGPTELNNLTFSEIDSSYKKGDPIKYCGREGVYLESRFYGATCQGNNLIVPGIKLIYQTEGGCLERHFLTYKKMNSSSISFEELKKVYRKDYKKFFEK